MAPGGDRGPSGEFLLDGLVHRLHLRRQTRQDIDVLEHEAGCAAERVRQRAAAGGKHRPPRRVLGVASETLAEVRGDLWVLGLLDGEGCRDGLASNVVRGAAEAAGNDDQVGTVGLLAQGRDRKSTRLNSSHPSISYAVFCLKKKNPESTLLFVATTNKTQVIR